MQTIAEFLRELQHPGVSRGFKLSAIAQKLDELALPFVVIEEDKHLRLLGYGEQSIAIQVRKLKDGQLSKKPLSAKISLLSEADWDDADGWHRYFDAPHTEPVFFRLNDGTELSFSLQSVYVCPVSADEAYSFKKRIERSGDFIFRDFGDGRVPHGVNQLGYLSDDPEQRVVLIDYPAVE
ncbi:hypothetical protein BH10CYA1_BH10CYA1_17950 [soil metagenome]